jgi:hypothetical protein
MEIGVGIKRFFIVTKKGGKLEWSVREEWSSGVGIEVAC